MDVTGVGSALIQSSVFGVPGLDAPVSGVVVATSSAIGSVGADIAKMAAATASTSARAVGRVDRELKLVGVASAGAFATAIIRAEGPAIVARAQSRVLPVVEATSEVLPSSRSRSLRCAPTAPRAPWRSRSLRAGPQTSSKTRAPRPAFQTGQASSPSLYDVDATPRTAVHLRLDGSRFEVTCAQPLSRHLDSERPADSLFKQRANRHCRTWCATMLGRRGDAQRRCALRQAERSGASVSEQAAWR